MDEKILDGKPQKNLQATDKTKMLNTTRSEIYGAGGRWDKTRR